MEIQIFNIFKRINKINLSNDASEILDILLLTNAYYPDINITEEQFLEIKSKWLIKNSNLQLIENYLLKNQVINEHPELTKSLVDIYLSRSEIKKHVKYFLKLKILIKMNIYLNLISISLINNNKKEEAQLLLDLKKELGFNDEFKKKKIKFFNGVF